LKLNLSSKTRAQQIVRPIVDNKLSFLRLHYWASPKGIVIGLPDDKVILPSLLQEIQTGCLSIEDGLCGLRVYIHDYKQLVSSDDENLQKVMLLEEELALQLAG